MLDGAGDALEEVAFVGQSVVDAQLGQDAMMVGGINTGSATRERVARAASASTFSAWASTPRAAGICWRAMMTAIPTVNPSTTEMGTYRMTRPARAYPGPIRIKPAITPTTKTPSGPCRAMIGTRTTVIAPVGPLTWTPLPPKIAASACATIAVARPATAPMPELTPNPNASGNATSPTVNPAVTSRPSRAPVQSLRRGNSCRMRSVKNRRRRPARPRVRLGRRGFRTESCAPPSADRELPER